MPFSSDTRMIDHGGIIMKRFVLGIAIAAMLATTLPIAAQTPPLPERITRAGSITIGMNPIYPPMEFRDPQTGRIVGADIDLANELFQRLGLRINWQESAFAQLIPSLTTERIDVIWSGMSDLPARRETMDFVNYMHSGPQFYTMQARIGEFRAMTDLCGKNVGTSRTTAFPRQIEEWSQRNCVAAGRPAINVVGNESTADSRAQLRQGRLDAAVQGSETIGYVFGLDPGVFATIGEPFADLRQGIGFRKADTQLRNAVAVTLGAMIADGSYQRIMERWALRGNMLTAVTINGEPFRP